jgi:serine/threonine protein kinase
MRPKNTGPFDEATIAVMAHDTLLGLRYLHNDMRIHRDVKGARPPLGPPDPTQATHT